MNLTKRELVVLRHLAEGLTQDETALVLGITRYGVKRHVETICCKMGASSAIHAVHLAHVGGLLGTVDSLVIPSH